MVQCGNHRWASGSTGSVREACVHSWYLSAGCLYHCSKENPDPRPYVQNPQTRTTCPGALNLSHTFLSPPHANAECAPHTPTSSTPWEKNMEGGGLRSTCGHAVMQPTNFTCTLCTPSTPKQSIQALSPNYSHTLIQEGAGRSSIGQQDVLSVGKNENRDVWRRGRPGQWR